MAKQKFTVILMPDGDGYHVNVPDYPDVNTWGQTPEEAFEMAQECLELVLEVYAEEGRDPVLPEVHASHMIVGTVEAEVPEALMSEIREYEAEMENRKPEEEREREAAAMFAKEGVRYTYLGRCTEFLLCDIL
ncbi:MAG: type II toxin-antitoxin system HicB family antitoxin [Dehalococcoidia bacterium]|nr:type II toxin-antitoxin system HicB family antitoxin [Dehalococcoidia bacterium]